MFIIEREGLRKEIGKNTKVVAKNDFCYLSNVRCGSRKVGNMGYLGIEDAKGAVS
jgi:hypothetical protein